MERFRAFKKANIVTLMNGTEKCTVKGSVVPTTACFTALNPALLSVNLRINLNQNEAQSARGESTHKGVN